MIGFRLKDGDLDIVNGEISMVEDSELKAQTIKQVISTNRGEWLFDKDEGINFGHMFQDSVRKPQAGEISRQEYNSLKQNASVYNALAKKLERRLDGED